MSPDENHLLVLLPPGLKTRATLTPLLVAPLAMPMLLASSQIVDALRNDESIVVWVLLLLAINLAMSVIGVATARPLEESAI